MLKRIIIIIAFLLGIPSVYAMQQQKVQRQQQKVKQMPKPAEHTHDGCNHHHDTAPQEQTNTSENSAQDTKIETKDDAHIHEWAPEHAPCHLCGCDGVSAFGICDWTVYGCLGRPHMFTCTICGITKLSIED